MFVPFNKNKQTSRWLFPILIRISIVPYSGCSEMFLFLTSITTSEYWFRETAFQLRESQEGTERLRGASVGCYHLHDMNSLLRYGTVIWSKPATLLRRNPSWLIVHSYWFPNLFFSSRGSRSSFTCKSTIDPINFQRCHNRTEAVRDENSELMGSSQK